MVVPRVAGSLRGPLQSQVLAQVEAGAGGEGGAVAWAPPMWPPGPVLGAGVVLAVPVHWHAACLSALAWRLVGSKGAKIKTVSQESCFD